MNVVLFAWCATGSAYLDALHAAGHSPSLVVTGEHAPASLAERAARLGVPLERAPDPNEPAFVARLARRAFDLAFVAGCSEIWRAPLLGVPRLGAVNLHPSLLPRHRGRDPVFWTVLEGDARAGVTAHRMTSAIDAGPVLGQRAIDVPPRATHATLSAELDRASAALVAELAREARRGALPPGIAPREPGSHDRRATAADGALDLRESAALIDRRVRAATGLLRATTSYRGMKLVVLDAEPCAEPAAGAPGLVLARDERGLVVATGRGALALRRFLFLERAHDALSLAALLELEPGELLGV